MLPVHNCFNPCFDGSVARVDADSEKNRPSPSFNPCFDGSVARDGRKRGARALRSGFNPCFDGSVARELCLLARLAVSGFQSLF